MTKVTIFNILLLRLMMGEILPGKIRGSAASVATAFNWACTFVVTKTFADIIGKKRHIFIIIKMFTDLFLQLLLVITELFGFSAAFASLVYSL